MAFDPGKLTGIYVVEEDGEHWWKVLDFENLCHFLHQVVVDDETVFVIEKYTIMPRSISTSTFALEAIGAIKFIAEIENLKVVMQKPSDAKNVMSDDNLREHYWYDRRCNDHARDAQRHAGLYLLGKSNDGRLPLPTSRTNPGRSKTRAVLPVQRIDFHDQEGDPRS